MRGIIFDCSLNFSGVRYLGLPESGATDHSNFAVVPDYFLFNFDMNFYFASRRPTGVTGYYWPLVPTEPQKIAGSGS